MLCSQFNRSFGIALLLASIADASRAQDAPSSIGNADVTSMPPDDAPEVMAPVGTAFTYQGKIDQTGVPVNSSCSFQFSLWDASSGGTQIGSTQTVTGLTVVNGLFTTTLDFGAGAFAGTARWLLIAVKCGSDPGYTPLSPRQPITPAPYAMFALGGSAGLSLPFAGSASAPGIAVFDVVNTATSGAAGIQARALNSPNAIAIVGHGVANGGYFDATGPTGNGIQSYASGTGTGVYAGSPSGVAVFGGSSGTVPAIDGLNTLGTGVRGTGGDYGVRGTSNAGIGVFGEYGSCFGPPSGASAGVNGVTCSTNPGSAGVRGEAGAGYGVEGSATTGRGIYGHATGTSGVGVVGTSSGSFGQGVYGDGGSGGNGVWATCSTPFAGALIAKNWNPSGYAAYFQNPNGGTALWVDGAAQVKVLSILGADLVEKFDTNQGDRDAGTVVVIDEKDAGKIHASTESYDRKVAGVVSGAGGIEHGICLGQGSALDGDTPVAMTGRVYVKCTAENGPIRPGDRLTTSSVAGHAMRATDEGRAGGAVIGKAMGSLDEGNGLVLVLVNLQ